MVRHLVLIKVAGNVSSADIDSVFKKMEALKTKIPGIISFDAGVNNSPEEFSRDYTHVFMMDFADVQSRDSYLPHPDHQAVQPPLLGILSDDEDPVLVIDFEF
jgi:hypothetical protein